MWQFCGKLVNRLSLCFRHPNRIFLSNSKHPRLTSPEIRAAVTSKDWRDSGKASRLSPPRSRRGQKQALLRRRVALGLRLKMLSSFFAIYFLRLDRVYYGNRLSDTQDVMDLTPLVKDVATPIDQRSTPGEQIKSKSRQAKDVIIKWANNPNLNEYLLTKMKDEKAQ